MCPFGISVFLKKLGIVVDGSPQSFITVIKLWLDVWSGIEVDPSFILLELNACDFQRQVVPIVDNHSESLRTGEVEVDRCLLNINLLAVAVHVNTTDLARSKPFSLPIPNFQVTAAIGLGRIDSEIQPLNRCIRPKTKGQDRFFTLLFLLRLTADLSP